MKINVLNMDFALKFFRMFLVAWLLPYSFSYGDNISLSNAEIKDILTGIELGRSNTLKKLKTLQARGVNLQEIKDMRNNTLLHHASHYGRLELAEWLVKEVRVDIDAQNKLGNTAVLLAFSADHTEVGRMLTRAGAKLTIPNTLGQTAVVFIPVEHYGEIAAEHPDIKIASEEIESCRREFKEQNPSNQPAGSQTRLQPHIP